MRVFLHGQQPMNVPSLISGLLAYLLWLAPGLALADNQLPTDCRLFAPAFKYTELNSSLSQINWDFMSVDRLQLPPRAPDCSQEQIYALRMIHQSLPQIKSEWLAGQGRYSTEVLNLMGCPKSLHPELLARTRERWQPYFEAEDYPHPFSSAQANLWFQQLVQVINEQQGCQDQAVSE